MKTKTAPGLKEIQEARARLEGIARVTPVYGTETLSKLIGREVALKAENLQRTGSFKIRGAVNKIATLTDGEKRAGVVAASAGNHGQAVAWAAREAGVKATVFVPQDAPMAKVEPTKNYGAKVELVGATFEDALAAALELRRGDRRDVRPPLRGRARDRRPGDDRARARRAGAAGRDGRDPGRRRRPLVGNRARAAGGAAGRAHRRRPGGALRADDRGRDRGQAGRRQDGRDPRGSARRPDRDRRRRDLPRDRAAAGAHEARRRGRGRGRRGRAADRARPAATGRRSRSSPAATSTRPC